MKKPIREWKLKKAWKAKRQGQVWVVQNRAGHRGYFKFATKKQWYFSGPMIANEYIAAALAKKVGIPIAALEMATVAGPGGVLRKGIVSKEVQAKEIKTWKEAGSAVYRNAGKVMNQTDLLQGLVVFDAWIANIDRASGKNLIIYRNSPAEKYNWYLIDHGHTLYGSPRKWKRGAWNAPIWRKLWLFYHVPKGLLTIQSSLDRLEPMIQKIESLTESDIDAAIRSVPKGYLREKERIFIRRLLLYRQKWLRRIIGNWLSFKGQKESGRT